MSKWTSFMDMHSGGDQKLNYGMIFIEAPEEEAKVIFQNRLGRDPENVTCDCCGEDYSTLEGDSLAEVTAYDRNCDSVYLLPDGSEFLGPEQEAWNRSDVKGVNRYAERPRRPYQAGGQPRKFIPLDDYIGSGNVLVIPAGEIEPADRTRG